MLRISAVIGIATFAFGILAGAVQTKTKVSEIVLERTPCFGACPVYKATLKADGTLIYEGIRFVPRIGKYKASIYEFDRLAEAAAALKLDKMKDRYSQKASDLPSATTTVVSSAGTKKIEDYGDAGPVELWAFDKAIDGVVARASGWEKM